VMDIFTTRGRNNWCSFRTTKPSCADGRGHELILICSAKLIRIGMQSGVGWRCVDAPRQDRLDLESEFARSQLAPPVPRHCRARSMSITARHALWDRRAAHRLGQCLRLAFAPPPVPASGLTTTSRPPRAPGSRETRGNLKRKGRCPAWAVDVVHVRRGRQNASARYASKGSVAAGRGDHGSAELNLKCVTSADVFFDAQRVGFRTSRRP